MARATYTEIQCKSALNRVTGMPFNWSLNPYRGCVHSCHYCYARATHAYFGLNADEDFETKVFVKTNIAEVLRKELAKASWPREQVAIGTATDCYQPAEGQFQLTRRCLEALRDARTPVGIVTKSTLILRDLDLLVEIERVAKAKVYFTLTTLDSSLARSLEPGTPPPAKRLAALRRLTEGGVPCGVLMAPLIPGITDSADSIESVAEAARECGAVALHVSPLRLAPLVREHYLAYMSETFPELLERYKRAYRGEHAPEAYLKGIEERANRIRAAYGYTDQWARIPAPPPDYDPSAPKQLSLTLIQGRRH